MAAFEDLNTCAGIAALINSLLLWPIVRSLKTVTGNHNARITRLETRKARRRRTR